jgi:hypothetical protein
MNLAIGAFGLTLFGCDGDNGPQASTFTVNIQNVSLPGTLATDRAMGTVPLSPGVYAVFSGPDPVFTPGSEADEGTELIAEDGFTMIKAQMLAASTAAGSGTFESPGGPDAGPAIFAGEMATFTISATPGDRLQLETMFVQSNDWFYAFGGGGLELFEGDTPVSGDVTPQLVLYDAGTEEDTAPGTGPDQKPVQDPAATNVGLADDNAQIRSASEDGFAIPATASIIRVTITPSQ